MVAGNVNLVAVVLGTDGAAIVLDVHGARLPAGPARLTFNATFGGVLLAGALAVDERGTRFLPNAKGLSYAQRRETFRVAVALPRDDRAAGQRLGGVHDAEPVDRRRAAARPRRRSRLRTS